MGPMIGLIDKERIHSGGVSAEAAEAAGKVTVNGVDLTYFLVVEVARGFGFPGKNQGAESLGDFRYALSPRHWHLPWRSQTWYQHQ